MATIDSTRNDWLTTAYAECIDSLIKYLRKFVGSRQTAEDLAHDAFVRVYTAKNFDQDRCPEGYLFTAARNLALTRNGCHRVTRTEAMEKPEGIRDDRASVERDVLLEQELDALQAAMAYLTPQQYDVVSLYAVGRTYQSIADELGISKPTVHREMARALETLAAARLM